MPGPGHYSLPSFVDVNRTRKATFFGRSREDAEQHRPGPSAYTVSYSQVERKRAVSFGRDVKLRSAEAESVGPGTYSIKSHFDRIVEKYRNAKARCLVNKSKSKKSRIQLIKLKVH